MTHCPAAAPSSPHFQTRVSAAGTGRQPSPCRSCPTACLSLVNTAAFSPVWLLLTLRLPLHPFPVADAYLVNKSSSTLAAAITVGVPLVAEER